MDRKEIRLLFQHKSRTYPPMTQHAREVHIKKASYSEYCTFLEDELIALTSTIKIEIDGSKLVGILKKEENGLR